MKTSTSTEAAPGKHPPIPAGVGGVPFLIFLAITLLVFGRALFNDYAYDGSLLLGRMSEPAAKPLAIILDPANYGSGTGVMSWRPLGVLAMLALDIRLFHLDAGWSHGLNLLIHATSAWLLFVLAGLLNPRGRRESHWLAGLLFCVHPLVSEAVLCAGFRFDLLAQLFSLLSITTLLWGMQGGSVPSGKWLAAAAGWFLLGLLSKENAVLVVVMAPFLVLVTSGDRAAAARTGVLFLAVTGLFALAWVRFRYAGYTTAYFGGAGRAVGVANFLVSAVEVYTLKLLAPWPLRVDYAFQPVGELLDSRVVVAIGVLVVLGIVSIAPFIPGWRKERRLTGEGLCGATGLLWVLLGFAPVAQLVPVPDPVAERFCYVPIAGVALLAGALFATCAAWKPEGRRWMWPAALLLLGVLAALSYLRTRDWRDDVTLNIANWEQSGDERPVARRSLGALYLAVAAREGSRGRGEASREALDRARRNLALLMESPSPPKAEDLRLYGVLELMSGHRDEARKLALRALELAPNDPEVVLLGVRSGAIGPTADDGTSPPGL